MNKERVIGEYLIEQLFSHGIRDIFGIPGDYVLGLYDLFEKSPIRVINTSDEQGAGFAADAYARINGIGAVCITYCVGGLKVANTTAQAFAEKSPVIVVSGSPGISERVKNPLLHHKVKDFDTQKKIFEELTIASTVIDDPHTAMTEIDRVIHAVEKFKLPGYIEIPRDMVHKTIDPSYRHKDIDAESDISILAEAIEETVAMINSAKQPVILAGIELHRFGLQQLFVEFVEKFKIPFASTIMNKSAITESHPYYMGVYEGTLGQDKVCSFVESSDCLLMFGAMLTDFNLGLFTAHLDPKKVISANKNKVGIKHHNYEDILLEDYLGGLLQADIMP
ncbi:MAG: thiamine pyrophosphate-binding protein, partial [Candidatus Aminicenantes bacterium]|nr:thiamine pyrophosphate-binding protein [Candidatus Aminicenantes bacterium]